MPFPIDLQPKGELENGKRYESVGSGEVMNTPQIRGRGLSICAAATVAFPPFSPPQIGLCLFSFFFCSTAHSCLPHFFLNLSFSCPSIFHTSPPLPTSSSSSSSCYHAEGLFWRCFEGVDRLSSERSQRARAAFFADRLDKRAEAAWPSSQRAAHVCRRNRKKASDELPRGCDLES